LSGTSKCGNPKSELVCTRKTNGTRIVRGVAIHDHFSADALLKAFISGNKNICGLM